MSRTVICLKCHSELKTSYQGKKPVCRACYKYFELNYKCNINKKIEYIKGNPCTATQTDDMGKEAEKKFFIFCSKYPNIKIRFATKYEEVIYHYDYVLQFNVNNIKSYFRVEVKSMKSKKRGEKQDPDIIFLEYKNIKGGLGWLYGKADYIAFEQKSYFILFPRIELIEFAENKMRNIEISEHSGNINTLYSRKNRNDLIGCFLLEEIRSKCNNFYILN